MFCFLQVPSADEHDDDYNEEGEEEEFPREEDGEADGSDLEQGNAPKGVRGFELPDSPLAAAEAEEVTAAVVPAAQSAIIPPVECIFCGRKSVIGVSFACCS